jgi:hypothetical protein
MQAQRGAVPLLYSFLSLVVGRRKTPSTLPPENRASTHFTGGCMDPRAGLNSVEKRKYLALPGFESRNIHPIAI